MECDSDSDMATAGPSKDAGKVMEKKRFEVKKWNAVALWAWDIVVDNCAICRNHIMDLCIECQANQVDPIHRPDPMIPMAYKVEFVVCA